MNRLYQRDGLLRFGGFFMTELVDAEYERLVRESADLKHEYGQLRERSSDNEAHKHHHAKVLAHIVALRAHIRHLRDRNLQT